MNFLKNLINLGILTLITVIAWIGFNIYHNLSTSQISEVTKIRIEPIESTFDQEALNLLNARQFIQSDLSEQTKIKAPPSTTLTPSPTQPPQPSIEPISTSSSNLLLETPTPTPTILVVP